MSTSIYKEMSYTPYGYHIMHKPTGRMYIGSRTKKGCHPDELWNPNYKGGGYFTSSKIVKKILKEDGIDSFEVLHVYTGETKEEVLAKEEEILMLFGAAQSELMLNMHNGGKNFSQAGRCGELSPTYGKPQSEAHKQKLSKVRKGKKLSEEHKQKIGLAGIGKHVGGKSACAKIYKITTPTGETLIIKGLKHFCREHNLDHSNLIRVAKGKQPTHKGYKCEYYQEITKQ